MNIDSMNENYHLRKYFLRTQEVPTQSLIKKKMSEPLAAVYFNSMTPELKLVAGLEPPMNGGGDDWYVPPDDLLKGRTVLKPFKKQYMSRLNYLGIDEVSTKPLENLRNLRILEAKKAVSENNENWNSIIEDKCKHVFKDLSEKAAKMNSSIIIQKYKGYSKLYAVSITRIENVMYNATLSEINRIQNETSQKMKEKYITSVKQQATVLYDSFSDRLMAEKLRLKGEFVQSLERYRDELGDKLHDLKLEKHVIIEKFRKFWECQRLACQVYVALKEREECKKDLELANYKHTKKVKTLSDEIATKDYEIIGRTRKQNLQLEFEAIWQRKVGQVLKHFQTCVSYCLNMLPAYADFFISIEKLMLLHLNEVLENPNAKSIFEFETEWSGGPKPDPHPLYLFCDKSDKYELHINKDLCPKRCTSSASHMPVIVINKRCIYAACDNVEQFTNKIKNYMLGERGDDIDFTDDHVYEYDVPVKYTRSQQLAELKLESSLLQVLHQEITTPFVCDVCKVPYCYCTNQPADATKTEIETYAQVCQSLPGLQQTVSYETTGNTFYDQHRLEPTMETYLKSIVPKQCSCSKTAKKHLMEHLPIYMRKMSDNAPYSVPNYEPCSLDTLKKMVRRARGVALPIPRSQDKTRDIATQYNDEQYDKLCTCFSDEIIFDLMKCQSPELSIFYQPTKSATHFKFLDDSESSTSVSCYGSVG